MTPHRPWRAYVMRQGERNQGGPELAATLARLASHSLQARAQRFAPRAQHALSTWKIRIKQVREPELARDWANWGPKQGVAKCQLNPSKP